MMVRRRWIAMLTLGTAVLGACVAASRTAGDAEGSSGLDEVEPGGQPDATDAGADAATGPTDAEAIFSRYHAFLASGTCSDVAGKGGTWRSRSAFPDAPAAIRDVACTYDWSSSSGAVPDLDALRALEPELLTRSVDQAPDLRLPASLEVVPIVVDGGDSAPTGVTGCDVCGRVIGRHAFAILPADDMNLRTLVVTTDTGRFLSFDVQQQVAGNAQVFSVTLPPLQEGSYDEGHLVLLEKAF